MITVAQFADLVGRGAISQALGHSNTNAVSNAIARGQMPAAWYLAVRALAAQAGVECPDSLFAMRPVPEDLGQ